MSKGKKIFLEYESRELPDGKKGYWFPNIPGMRMLSDPLNSPENVRLVGSYILDNSGDIKDRWALYRKTTAEKVQQVVKIK